MVVHLYRGQGNIETKQHEVLRSNFLNSEAKPMKDFVDFFFTYKAIFIYNHVQTTNYISIFWCFFFFDNISKGH